MSQRLGLSAAPPTVQVYQRRSWPAAAPAEWAECPENASASYTPPLGVGDIGTASIIVIPQPRRVSLSGAACQIPYVSSNSTVVYDCVADPTTGLPMCPLADGTEAQCEPVTEQAAAASSQLVIVPRTMTSGVPCVLPFVYQ